MKLSRIMLQIIASLSILLFTGCGSATPTTTQSQTSSNTTNLSPWLRTVSGTVEIKRNGTLIPANIHTTLQTGDKIQTNATSTTDIVWPGYGHTLLDHNSVLDLTESADSAQSITEKLTLTSGRIWTRLQKLLDTDSTFNIKASDVILTVRGTSFGVNLMDKDVNVQVKDSKVGAARSSGAEVLIQAGQETTIHPTDTTIPTPTTLSAQALNDPFVIQGDQPLSKEELNADISDQKQNTGTTTIIWSQPQACPQYGAPKNCYGNTDDKCGGYDNWSKTCATFIWNINPCAEGQKVVGYTSATCSYDTGTMPHDDAKASVTDEKLTIDCTEFAKRFKTEACTCNNGISLHATVECR